MHIFIGTTNLHKVREIASILGPIGVKLSVTAPVDPPETGNTFMENAHIKGRVYSRWVFEQLVAQTMRHKGCSKTEAEAFVRLSEIYVISEDSGVAADGLGGLPGPYSARFCECVFDEAGLLVKHAPKDKPSSERDQLNNLQLLNQLEGCTNRAARMHVAMVVYTVAGHPVFESEASVTGRITHELKGERGFGYDPIFETDHFPGLSWGEVDPMRKNLVSPRRTVLNEVMRWIMEALK